MPSLRDFALVFLFGLFGFQGPAKADRVYLKNGTPLDGKVVSFLNGILTLELEGGETRSLGVHEVSLIQIDEGLWKSKAKASAWDQPQVADSKVSDSGNENGSKAPSPPKDSKKESNEANFLQTLDLESDRNKPFATPTQTFQTWYEAAVRGDRDAMVRCYASFRKKEVKKQLKEISKSDWEKMKATTAETQFIPGQPLYQGDRASLEVNWQKGLIGENQVIQFVLEGNEWKIIR